MNIYIIDTDSTVSSELTQKVDCLGLGTCKTVAVDIPIDELASFNTDLAILGPSLDTHMCLKWIHKFKIIDSFMPVLTFCSDLFASEGTDITPFQGIYSIGQPLGPDKITATIEKALQDKEESENSSDYSILIGQSREMMALMAMLLPF